MAKPLNPDKFIKEARSKGYSLVPQKSTTPWLTEKAGS